MQSQADPPQLSIVLLNYRTGDMTVECLQGILDECAQCDIRVETIIVDNASGDGSDEVIAAYLESTNIDTGVMRLVRSPVNGGFSAGNNLGIKAAKSDFILLLNSDTLLTPGCLTALIECAHKSPAAGIIGAQLMDADGTKQYSHFNYISPISEFLVRAGIGFFDRIFRHYIIRKPIQSTQITNPADWVSFAGVLVRRDLIDAIGLMDEGYFLYFEDTDYCQMARKAGWGVLQATQSLIIHKRGGSGPVKQIRKAGKRLPRYYYESRARYFKKHYGGTLGLILTNLMIYLAYCVAAASRIYKTRRLFNVEKEWRDIWIGL
ncbi:MAG: glycosyltransferase family 2 protein [Pseudomonadota bacterium]